MKYFCLTRPVPKPNRRFFVVVVFVVVVVVSVVVVVVVYSELGDAAESLSSLSRSPGDEDWPPFTLFHFILRFWNHTLT